MGRARAAPGSRGSWRRHERVVGHGRRRQSGHDLDDEQRAELGGRSSTTGSAGGATSTAQGAGGVTSTTDASSSSDASSSVASSSAASGTGGGGATAYYGASFAACNSEQNLDIVACEKLYGPGTMDIDLSNDALVTDRAFIRFDLGGAFAGKTIDAVTLRLTTLSDPATQANSDNSGQIWRVTPFDAASLGMAQPTNIGGVIGMGLGPVEVGKDYYWGLPVDLLAPDSPVFLALDTKSDDGARYWNDHGTVPPLLIVNYH